MDEIGGLFKSLIDLWTEMFGKLFPMLLVGLSFLLWVVTALIVLPCVFVAGTLYPMWEKWGEEF